MCRLRIKSPKEIRAAEAPLVDQARGHGMRTVAGILLELGAGLVTYSFPQGNRR